MADIGWYYWQREGENVTRSNSPAPAGARETTFDEWEADRIARALTVQAAYDDRYARYLRSGWNDVDIVAEIGLRPGENA